MKTSRKTTTRRTAVAAIFLAALALTSCWSDDDTTQEQSSPAPTTPADVSQQPESDVDTGQTDGDNENGQADPGEDTTRPIGDFTTGASESENWPDFGDAVAVYPTEIRAAVHDGFERIVIEHHGSGTPSYSAHYTDEPVAPGSGMAIDTGDVAYLEVVLSGTTPPDFVEEEDLPEILASNTEITDLDTEATGTVVSFAPWEATSNYFIGLDEQRPYAVALLEDPVRLVIDIQLDNTGD